MYAAGDGHEARKWVWGWAEVWWNVMRSKCKTSLQRASASVRIIPKVALDTLKVVTPQKKRQKLWLIIDPINRKWLIWDREIHIFAQVIKKGIFNRPHSIYRCSNMALRLSGQTSIFGLAFFASKSPLGIEIQKKLKIFTILTRKPRSYSEVGVPRSQRPVKTDTVPPPSPLQGPCHVLLSGGFSTCLWCLDLSYTRTRPKKVWYEQINVKPFSPFRGSENKISHAIPRPITLFRILLCETDL